MAITVTDTGSVAATNLTTISGVTTGTVAASNVSTLTGFAGDINIVYADSGITGLGDEAVTLSDTTLASSVLNDLNGNTTGIINAASVTTLTGTASAVNTTYANLGSVGVGSGVQISNLGDEIVTLSDVTAQASELVTLDGNTTGVINTTDVQTVEGSISDLGSVYTSSGFSNLGNEAITVSDTGTVDAANLTTVNSYTSGLVSAAGVQTINGTASAILTLLSTEGTSGDKVALDGDFAMTVSSDLQQWIRRIQWLHSPLQER